MLSIGTMLQDRYRIENVLGQGGMGSVYLATHIHLGRYVAIKQLYVRSNDAAVDSAALRQFKNEAQILQSLSHPRLPSVYDYIENDGNPYLIMEYVKGRSLATVLENEEEPLPLSQVRDWATSLCDVLDYLHGHNPPVIFRDLKPSNVMLDVDGQIRLIDFGISKVFVAGGVTHTFAKGAGSPGFSAPEQYSLTTDARSDIYSFGATLFALLTGKAPPSSVELAAGLMELPAIQRYRADISPALSDVVYACMQIRASARPKTATVVKDMLLAAFAAPAPAALASAEQGSVDELQPASAATTVDLGGSGTLRIPLETVFPESKGAVDSGAERGRQRKENLWMAAIGIVVICVLLLLAYKF